MSWRHITSASEMRARCWLVHGLSGIGCKAVTPVPPVTLAMRRESTPRYAIHHHPSPSLPISLPLLTYLLFHSLSINNINLLIIIVVVVVVIDRWLLLGTPFLVCGRRTGTHSRWRREFDYAPPQSKTWRAMLPNTRHNLTWLDLTQFPRSAAEMTSRAVRRNWTFTTQ